MRWIFVSILSMLTLLVTASTALSNDEAQDACASLERPNIDCQCVAKRISTYQRFAPTQDAKRLVIEHYKKSLGLSNDYGAAVRSAYGDESDFMRRMAIEESFDQIGGTPSGVEDFESGCVMAGANPVSVPSTRSVSLSSDYSSDSYIAACLNAIGASDKNRRYCQCQTSRLTSRLSDPEFEAYYRSFSQYGQGNLSELRAKSMGISASAYDRLSTSARSKIEPNKSQDEAFCNARIWADEMPGLDADARQLAGFEPGIALAASPAPLSSPDHMSGDPVDRARKVVADSCSKNGNSETYCACYMRDFESRVVSKSANGNVTLAWALMQGDSAMTQMDYIATMQSLSREDQQAAGMMLMSTSDLGESCSQGEPAEVAAMKGSPADRMMTICIAENEDRALCECAVGKMEESFSPDDFELFVDIREAEFNGAEDAFAKVAEDRGLSRAEAETALENNPALMGGAMAMASSAMQCMGGMPNMSGIPGMPQIPGMLGQ